MKFVPLLAVLLSGCSVVAEYPVTAASIAVWGATGKGPADHALSSVAERDCATLRVVDGEKICRDYTVADVVDRTTAPAATPKPTTVAAANDIFAQRARRR